VRVAPNIEAPEIAQVAPRAATLARAQPGRITEVAVSVEEARAAEALVTVLVALRTEAPANVLVVALSV
jgi:hypothetical protein